MSDATLEHPGAADYDAIVTFPGFSLGICSDGDAIVAIDFLEPCDERGGRQPLAQAAVRQLRGYLKDRNFAVQSAARTGRHRLPATRLGGYRGHSRRPDAQLWRTRRSPEKQSRARWAPPAAPIPTRLSCPAIASSRPAAAWAVSPASAAAFCSKSSAGCCIMKESSSRAARRVHRRPLARRRPGEEHAGRLPFRSCPVFSLAGRAQ